MADLIPIDGPTGLTNAKPRRFKAGAAAPLDRRFSVLVGAKEAHLWRVSSVTTGVTAPKLGPTPPSTQGGTFATGDVVLTYVERRTRDTQDIGLSTIREEEIDWQERFRGDVLDALTESEAAILLTAQTVATKANASAVSDMATQITQVSGEVAAKVAATRKVTVGNGLAGGAVDDLSQDRTISLALQTLDAAELDTATQFIPVVTADGEHARLPLSALPMGGGASTLAELSDLTPEAPTEGQALVFGEGGAGGRNSTILTEGAFSGLRDAQDAAVGRLDDAEARIEQQGTAQVGHGERLNTLDDDVLKLRSGQAGPFRYVVDAAERDGLSEEERFPRMLVTVLDTGISYRLKPAPWLYDYRDWLATADLPADAIEQVQEAAETISEIDGRVTAADLLAQEAKEKADALVDGEQSTSWFGPGATARALREHIRSQGVPASLFPTFADAIAWAEAADERLVLDGDGSRVYVLTEDRAINVPVVIKGGRLQPASAVLATLAGGFIGKPDEWALDPTMGGRFHLPVTEQIDIRQMGAVATDDDADKDRNWRAIQGCLDTMGRRVAGGRAVVPAVGSKFAYTQVLYGRHNVTLQLDGKLRNVGGFPSSPAYNGMKNYGIICGRTFRDRLDDGSRQFYEIEPVVAGDWQVKLKTPADAANLQIGDAIHVTSRDWSSSDDPPISSFNRIRRIVSIDMGTGVCKIDKQITDSYAGVIDISPVGRAPWTERPGSGLSQINHWMDQVVINFNIIGKGSIETSSMPIEVNGNYGGEYSGFTTDGARGVGYGNAFCFMTIRDIQCIVGRTGLEVCWGSEGSTFDNIEIVLKESPSESTTGIFSCAEFSTDIRFNNIRIRALGWNYNASSTTTSYVLFLVGTRITVTNSDIVMSGNNPGGATISIPSVDEIVNGGHRILNNTFRVLSPQTRDISIGAATNAKPCEDIIITGNTFKTIVTAYAADFGYANDCHVRDNRHASGTLRFQQNASDCSARHCRIPGGINLASSSAIEGARRNNIVDLRTPRALDLQRYWVTRSKATVATSDTNANRPIQTWLIPPGMLGDGDTIRLEIAGRVGGTGGAKAVSVQLLRNLTLDGTGQPVLDGSGHPTGWASTVTAVGFSKDSAANTNATAGFAFEVDLKVTTSGAVALISRGNLGTNVSGSALLPTIQNTGSVNPDTQWNALQLQAWVGNSADSVTFWDRRARHLTYAEVGTAA